MPDSNDASGTLVDQPKFASYSLRWDNDDFLLYVVQYPSGFRGHVTQHYLLHEGPEDRCKALLVAASDWNKLLHKEILVYDHGCWQKNHGLWVEVQKSNWDDVILKPKFRDALRKDVNGFYDAQNLYKTLAIPWKRGIILLGPPGNGKTISIKAIMKDCYSRGRAPLYVRSFRHNQGDEGGMAMVFDKARQMSPCVIILEDLDALITDKNRSFFLNQLDGLDGNDGLLVIGSTNHFDKLDPALSGRPSRFDRKYPFEDPDLEERTLYARYWQNKLRNSESVSFSDNLVGEIAAFTDNFSFAYLKEVFVSALVILAETEDEVPPSFEVAIMGQIAILQEQLQKASKDGGDPIRGVNAVEPSLAPAVPHFRFTEPTPMSL